MLQMRHKALESSFASKHSDILTTYNMFSAEFLAGQVDHRITCDSDMTAMTNNNTRKIAILEHQEANALMLQ